jgi:hypothetical protein
MALIALRPTLVQLKLQFWPTKTRLTTRVKTSARTSTKTHAAQFLRGIAVPTSRIVRKLTAPFMHPGCRRASAHSTANASLGAKFSGKAQPPHHSALVMTGFCVRTILLSVLLFNRLLSMPVPSPTTSAQIIIPTFRVTLTIPGPSRV